MPTGGWGQRPQSCDLASAWPHALETVLSRKKPRRGIFSLSPAPRSGLFVSLCPSRRVRVFAPGAVGFRAVPLPPPTGVDAGGGGGLLHPLRGVPAHTRAGTGEGGGASAPIVAQGGYNRRRRRPRYRLDKTLIFQFGCIVNNFNMIYRKWTF